MCTPSIGKCLADMDARLRYQACQPELDKASQADMKDCGTTIAMLILMMIIAALGTLVLK
jgi:hypothetical protein